MAVLFGQRPSRKSDSAIAKKSKVVKKAPKTVKSGSNIEARIAQAKVLVEKHLGQYADKYICIQDKEVLHDYITECIGNGYISIDTETDGLNPYVDRIAGICPFTYGQKGAYIPINHVSYITGEKVPGQIDAEFIIQEFNRLLKKHPDIDMFNANFDIRVLRQFGLSDMYCTWDGALGAKLLNENEPSNKLKVLHNKYCRNGVEDALSFSDLFEKIPFTKVPIKWGYLYAANDPFITTEYCDFQRQFLGRTPEEAREDLKDVSWVMHNIEVPCINVVCDMEDTGVALDTNYAKELSDKYHKIEEQKLQEIYQILDTYKDEIDAYRKSSIDITLRDEGTYRQYKKSGKRVIESNANKLEDPINIASPNQLAILLYDILKIPVVDKKKPRGTGEEILTKIDNPICKAILDYRGIEKLLSTYIDKLPNCLNEKDQRIHCKFNQYGAVTGRFSSSDPNLQNIPSHNKDIRKMFVATEGYVMMSSDYSQQEPKCLAALCKQHGDSQMYDTFMEGKDLYSEIASKAFNKPYEECKEFNEDGTTNKEGKERRTQAKSILLGVLYGRGEKSIAEQLGCSEEKAKAIKSSVFRGFPAIRQFEDDSKDMAYELGYVTTVCGRKRRLPDYLLDEFEFSWKDGAPPDDDLIDFDSDEEVDYDIPEKTINFYLRKLDGAWAKQKREIITQAKEDGIIIKDNGGKISEAERQVVNSRIQGSAADLTKLAMIELGKNQRLKELGFRLLIQVHDEVICECPKENAKECSQLLADTMSKAAEKILEMPIKCDVEITERWYGEVVDINGI